jgi:hypothetical protein
MLHEGSVADPRSSQGGGMHKFLTAQRAIHKSFACIVSAGLFESIRKRPSGRSLGPARPVPQVY